MKQFKIRRTVCGLACIAALAACSQQEDQQTATDTMDSEASTTASTLQASNLGVELSNMDRTVRPQDDFFHFVNGGWQAANEIPADRSRWSSFDELREAAEQHVLTIVQETAAMTNLVAGTDEQKVADLYRSYMDEATIEAAGTAPLVADFAAINGLTTHEDLASYWADTELLPTAPFGLFVGQDQRQSDQYVTSMSQSGLGLPDRDYYLNDDPRSQELRDLYKAHISRLFELAALPDGEGAAERILALETRIAQSHWTRVQNRDRNATYNRMSPAELNAAAPGFDWPRFIEESGLGAIDAIIIRQPDYFAEFAEFQREIPVSDWQDYQRFHLLRGASPFLSSAFVDADFDFYSRTLSGQPEMRSRELRGVSTVEQVLGFMVGQMYVDRHFQPEAKERMDALVSNLKVAFREAIDELEWMSADTKAEAQDKLSKFNTKIGYPDVWRDYDCVEISANDLLGNMRRGNLCEYQRMIGRLGSPVDREEWGMTPQTVNAYYNATMNEIVFPAGILQPPFFNVEADDAVNYGAIGGVIGHEITHGFDD